MDDNLKILLGVGVAGVVAYYLWPATSTATPSVVTNSPTRGQSTTPDSTIPVFNTTATNPTSELIRRTRVDQQLMIYDVGIDPGRMQEIISELALESDPEAIDGWVNIANYYGHPLSALFLHAKGSNLRGLLDNESLDILYMETDPDALYSEANVAQYNQKTLAAQYLRAKSEILRPSPVVQPSAEVQPIIPGEAPQRAPAPSVLIDRPIGEST